MAKVKKGFRRTNIPIKITRNIFNKKTIFSYICSILIINFINQLITLYSIEVTSFIIIFFNNMITGLRISTCNVTEYHYYAKLTRMALK